MLEALDYQLGRDRRRAKLRSKKPSEYFAQQFLRLLLVRAGRPQPRDIRKVGVDNVLFETDFPHPTGLYPIENLEGRLGDLTAAERAKVLSLNAAKLYNIAV